MSPVAARRVRPEQNFLRIFSLGLKLDALKKRVYCDLGNESRVD